MIGQHDPPALVLCLVSLCVSAFANDVGLGKPVEEPASDRWRSTVQLLASPNYHQRQRAAERLLYAGESAKSAILSGLSHEDLEVRTQCRYLLDHIQNRQQQRDLESLLSHYDARRDYQLPAWESFKKGCGDGLAARRLYKCLLRQQPQYLAWLQRVQDDEDYNIENQLDDQSRFLSPDVNQLNTGDPVAWTKLLLACIQPKISQIPVLGGHIRCGLLSPSALKGLKSHPYHHATDRLIQSWLQRQSNGNPTDSTIKIALLYRVDRIGLQLATRALSGRQASPAATQAALQWFAARKPSDAIRFLQEGLEDDRVCQVRSIIALRRRAIQTQVRDTALALLLHLHKIDPRRVGYQFVQADHMVVFQDQSMGFECEQDRAQAHQTGRRLLKL